jgi:hypothetical protein
MSQSATCIATSCEPVPLRGEELAEIWWRGKQWAVTAVGIECLDGCYFIDKKRLLEQIDEYPWPLHMVEKPWVDIDDFTTAWMVGILLHGYGAKAKPPAIQKWFEEICRLRQTQPLQPLQAWLEL